MAKRRTERGQIEIGRHRQTGRLFMRLIAPGRRTWREVTPEQLRRVALAAEAEGQHGAAAAIRQALRLFMATPIGAAPRATYQGDRRLFPDGACLAGAGVVDWNPPEWEGRRD